MSSGAQKGARTRNDEANARLIAAAPKMHKELKGVLRDVLKNIEASHDYEGNDCKCSGCAHYHAVKRILEEVEG